MDSINTLPNEILINIFGYVIPKCTLGKLSHNEQKMILGSVSKRFNELTKTAYFCKRINLRYIVSLVKPIKIGPTGKPMVKCEICSKECDDPSSFYRHLQIRNGGKPHQCPHCDCGHKRFSQRYNMMQHMRVHEKKMRKQQQSEIQDIQTFIGH